MEYIDNSFEAVIGLEVHTQLLTGTKMFCSCPNVFGKEPNSLVCPVCLALPGSLPVINFNAVKLAVKAALAINLNINKKSLFARKNYFYPDLPKGYQISQFQNPVSSNGYLIIDIGEGKEKKIRINRLHIEEDAGKLIHAGYNSFVDLNRAGTPLAEIVSEPDINSPAEAVAYLKELRDIIVYLDISDGNMEEGSFRCDANISVRKKGDVKLGTRTEVKNVNSFKFVEKALEYEINRQIELLLNGGKVIQETLLFNSKTGKTESMRGKEEAHDYRYFEEPDLPPLLLTDDFIENIKNSLGELPAKKRKRYISEYLLTELDAEVLTADKNIAFYFENTIKFNEVSGGSKLTPKVIANWIINDLLTVLKDKNVNGADHSGSISDNKSKISSNANANAAIPIPIKNFYELMIFVEDGKINKNTGKDVLKKMILENKSAGEIIEKENLAQVSDSNMLETLIEDVLNSNQKELSDYLSGKEKLFGFFVGEIMKKAKGKANPKIVNELLNKFLEDYKSKNK